MSFAEGTDELGKAHSDCTGKKADAQSPDLTAIGSLRNFNCMVGCGDNATRLCQKELARRRKRSLSRDPRKKLDADLFFQIRYLLADCRLGHVQPPCGSADTALLRHGDEIAQMPELHANNAIGFSDG